VPEKVPLWVVQNTFVTFGNRMQRRPSTLPDDLKLCFTCQKEMYTHVDWNYLSEKWYCNTCVIPARAAQSEIWKREAEERRREWLRDNAEPRNNIHGATYLRGGAIDSSRIHAVPRALTMNDIPRTEAEVPAGNLDQFLYQYWVGALDPTLPRGVMSSRSTCRACGEVVHGAMARAIHKTESQKYYKEGYSCMKVISLAIRDLAGKFQCFICNGYTTRKHYGVPICSPNCHKIWRFSEKHQYPELDLAIAPYWITEDTPATGGSIISESLSKSTPTVFLQEEQE
jgi:hypothetical protein